MLILFVSGANNYKIEHRALSIILRRLKYVWYYRIIFYITLKNNAECLVKVF